MDALELRVATWIATGLPEIEAIWTQEGFAVTFEDDGKYRAEKYECERVKADQYIARLDKFWKWRQKSNASPSRLMAEAELHGHVFTLFTGDIATCKATLSSPGLLLQWHDIYWEEIPAAQVYFKRHRQWGAKLMASLAPAFSAVSAHINGLLGANTNVQQPRQRTRIISIGENAL